MNRPPRATAWVLLLASAAAVLLVGLAATAFVFSSIGSTSVALPAAFWPAFLAGCSATVASLAVRAVRWAFLMRRGDARLPIRDAFIGYLAGLSLLLAPFLVGEIAVRAYVLRARCRIPVATTVAVNLWERLLDLTAVCAITVAAAIATGRLDAVAGAAAGLALALCVPAVRRAVLGIVGAVSDAVGRRFDGMPGGRGDLFDEFSWWVGLGTSAAAWLLPPMALLALTRIWGAAYGYWDAAYDYSASSGIAALTLAPGGILVAGARLLGSLAARGLPPDAAAMSIAGVRLATVGVSTALGAVMLVVHWRSAAADSETHFDDIAAAYDVQIPEARRLALLHRKTAMMQEALGAARLRGLDVGCGQGAYVQRMRELGYEMRGIDASAGQVAIAARKFERPGIVTVGSALSIPMPDASCDFVYTINVLHHLPSVADQRRAFVELFRVLRPGGTLFVHEINTRNVLFRFYMGYVFPSLNCIDEGTERWLLPTRLSDYTPVQVTSVRYFTFFPDFLPQRIVHLLAPLEAWLEGSPLSGYSAHYMASWRKPDSGGPAQQL